MADESGLDALSFAGFEAVKKEPRIKIVAMFFFQENFALGGSINDR
jgi:hypothetical protein